MKLSACCGPGINHRTRIGIDPQFGTGRDPAVFVPPFAQFINLGSGLGISGSPITMSWNVPITAGSLLYVAVSTAGDATFVTPTSPGWTQIQAVNNPGELQHWVFVSAPSNPGYPGTFVTDTVYDWVALGQEFVDLQEIQDIQAENYGSGAISVGPTSPTSFAPELVCGSFTYSALPPTWSSPWVNTQSQSLVSPGIGCSIGYMIANSTGPQTLATSPDGYWAAALSSYQ